MAFNDEIVMEFCRLCQSRLGKTSLQYNEGLINKIVTVTGIKLSDEVNNYLPTLVCLSCEEKVVDIFNYLQIVQNVDKKLRNAVKNKYLSNASYKEEEICADIFPDRNLLQTYNESHLDNSKNFKCSVCLKIYNRKIYYNLHKKNHPELYCCECFNIFEEAVDKMNHICKKESEDLKRCQPQKICKSKLQKTKPKFKIKTELLGLSTFHCNNCDKKFNDKNNLRMHLKTHINFTCPEENCSKQLPSAYSLKMHQLDHSGKKPYLCVTCGKSYKTKSTLSCHEKTHADIKAYKCNRCNIGFSVRSNLRAHEKKYHEGVRFHCSQCTKTFLSKCSLERHEKIHTGIRDFKCNQCSSQFYTKKELAKHQRYHQGLRQYKCEECFKTFFERHHLIIHLRSHSGEKPYVCTVHGCAKAFAESQKLKRHHSAKHKVVN